MPEGFSHFNETYKALFTSLLAFSSSGMAALILVATRKPEAINEILYYHISLSGFAASIIASLASAYWGLRHHNKEGRSSKALDFRTINDGKLIAMDCSITSFAVGFLFFLVIVWNLK